MRAAGGRFVSLETNRGFAVAVNRGVQMTGGEIVAVLNNDVCLEPDYFEKLVDALAGTTAFATGRIRMAHCPEYLDATFDLVARSGCSWRCGNGYLDRSPWTEGRNITVAPMTALLIRRDAFVAVGGLDESFGSYLEDVDFGLSCASKGYTGRYIPEAIAYHVGSGTRGPWHPQTVRQIARNQLLLVAKWLGRRGCLRNGWAIATGQLLWGVVAAKHGRAGAWFRGKIDGLILFKRHLRRWDAAVDTWLAGSEREIARLQDQAGWQPYWRWYFRLAGRPGR